MRGWFRQAMAKIALIHLVVAIAAVTVMTAPVSLPAIVTSITTYVAWIAGGAALVTGAFHFGQEFGAQDERERNLNIQDGLRADAAQMKGIESAAAVVGPANVAAARVTVEQVNGLVTEQRGIIDQQQLVITNLENNLQNAEQRFADEQRNNQRHFAGIQRQLDDLQNGLRRENRQNNANPGRLGMFGDNAGIHQRHRNAANDAHDENNQARVLLQ